MSFPDVHRGRFGLVVALVALGGFLGLASPGSAATRSTAPAESTGGARGHDGIALARWQALQPTVIRRHVPSKPTQPQIQQGTASCQAGEQLLSGGYQINRAEEVLSSFPSLATGEPAPDGAVVDSWTVVVREPVVKPDGQPAVEVYVACVADPLWLSRAYVTAQPFGLDMTMAQTVCPGDARLTGGGFEITREPAKSVPESVVASLPDFAPFRWTVYGVRVRDPDGGISGLPAFTYAVCATRPGLDTTIVLGPALVQPPDSKPACHEVFSSLFCDVHRVGEAFLTCPSGVLVAGATAPFEVDPRGGFDSKGWDRISRVTVSLPGRPFDPSDEPGWSLTLAYEQISVPSDDPAVKAGGQFPTLAICATVAESTPSVGVVIPPAPGPSAAPPTRNLSTSVRAALPWAALVALVVIVAALTLRSVRKRARRSRAAASAAPALVTIEPATPTDVIRMAGPHAAVSALLLPGSASHTWTERTSP